MSDLSSVAREAAEARYPLADDLSVTGHTLRLVARDHYTAGFIECALRLPSEEEIAKAMAVADGQVLSGLTDHMLDFMYGKQARSVLALIGEKIRADS